MKWCIGDFLSRRGLAPDRNWSVALEDHVVAKNAGECDIGLEVGEEDPQLSSEQNQ
jgi:hypothetical protein